MNVSSALLLGWMLSYGFVVIFNRVSIGKIGLLGSDFSKVAFSTCLKVMWPAFGKILTPWLCISKNSRAWWWFLPFLQSSKKKNQVVSPAATLLPVSI